MVQLLSLYADFGEVGAGMIKRVIEISRQAVHLSVRHEQLVIQPVNEDKSAATTIPCEDIGVVCIDHPGVSYSHQALMALMRSGAAVVVCGRDHLPTGVLLPFSTHSEVLWRVNEQINATEPRKKRLWQQIVRAKVQRQARNLPQDSPAARFLRQLAEEVRSGDKDNIEAQAARVYWSAWLDPRGCGDWLSSITAHQTEQLATNNTWRRNRDAPDPINRMLNYGYSVMRAAIARALVCAGLFPALSVFHRNRANPFALADDLIEPFRPLVDARVRQLYRTKPMSDVELDQAVKAALLQLLTHPVRCGETTGPLMVSLHRLTASFSRCLRGECKLLMLPDWDCDQLWT